jgi:hypothetical protein
MRAQITVLLIVATAAVVAVARPTCAAARCHLLGQLVLAGLLMCWI